jgi:hypothetical protein
MLELDNAVAIFRDPIGDRLFQSLELVGVAVVIVTTPLPLITLMVMQGPKVHMLMRLRFQTASDLFPEMRKVSKSLNLLRFRVPGSVVRRFTIVECLGKMGDSRHG